VAIHASFPNVLFAATASGVFRSLDSGLSWEPYNSGLTNLATTHLALNSQTPSTLFVTTTTGLYKRLLDDTNWTAVSLGATYTNIPATAIAIAPSSPNSMYVGSYVGVFSSVDAGNTWTLGRDGLTPPWASALAVDPTNPRHVFAGTVSSFPLGLTYAFVAKLNLVNGAVVYSQTFGGSATTIGEAVAVDSFGSAYVAGMTTSLDFPVTQTSGFFSPTNHGASDAFLAAFRPDGSDFIYSVTMGGPFNDYGFGVAIGPDEGAYLVGQTASSSFPVARAFQGVYGGGSADAFLAKIVGLPSLVARRQGGELELSWPAIAAPHRLESTVTLWPSANWVEVSPAPTYTNGTYQVTLPTTNAAGFFRLRFE